MPNNLRTLLVCLLLLPMAAAVPQQETDSEADGNPEDKAAETQSAEQEADAESPSMFIPREKISPDQVISFPADI